MSRRDGLWFVESPPRFVCTECGECCRRPGFVSLTRDEANAAARHELGEGADYRALLGEAWTERGEFLEIDVPGPSGDACYFLDERGRCRIHAVKPAQCRSYPFWPELLESPVTWRAEGSACEGIGQGEPWSPEAILARLEADS